MAEKKKTGLGLCDKLHWWLSILGSVLMLVSCVPVIPWRAHDADGNFGSYFTSGRSYSLFTASDPNGKNVAWMKLKADTCRKAEEFIKPSLPSVAKSQLAGIASTIGSLIGKKVPSAGAAWAGCASWTPCKEHTINRCASYKTISGLGFAIFFFILFGCIACGIGLVFVLKEHGVKKQAKKEETQYAALMASCVGFFLPLLATLVWIFVSGSIFDSLGSVAYYPYPALSFGVYIAAAGLLLLFVASLAAMFRQDTWKKPEEEEVEEDTVYEPSQQRDMYASSMGPQSGFFGSGQPPHGGGGGFPQPTAFSGGGCSGPSQGFGGCGPPQTSFDAGPPMPQGGFSPSMPSRGSSRGPAVGGVGFGGMPPPAPGGMPNWNVPAPKSKKSG
eukprot:TRINITY_DN5792_c0_g1_i1.p1 TRINITY_DN5792_c0_g1~~TRINITY_DN5792_c0_g1_i1.p1  ORF type:complete len:387 (-),score=63.42 TRINITY_DN5792_c0_g1_i1:127-1287(-)